MTDTAIPLTAREIHAAVIQAVNAAGSQAAFARKCKVAPALVSACLNGTKPMAPALVIGAGYMPVVRYLPVTGGGK